MNLFDLHCDSIVEMKRNDSDLCCKTTQLSLDCLSHFEKWCQTFAIFVPDTYRAAAAEEFFLSHERYFQQMMQKYSDRIEQVCVADDIQRITAAGKCAAILSVEGGAVLAGKLENIPKLAAKNVKFLTLTWNGENEIASGHDTQNGFSDFGREAIPVLEENKIVIDVSHLNDVGFDQMTSLVKRPVIATHSNSRAVCSHRRNLTDEQFSYLVLHKGLVGINLCEPFLSEKEGGGTKLALLRHVYHMLELGGEEVLACGSDFDGAGIHEELNNPVKFGEFGNYLITNKISPAVVEKIFYGNALRFCKENLN